MANIVDMKVASRVAGRKGPSKRLRVQGQFPAVVYGHGEPDSIAVATRDFEHMLKTSKEGSRTLLRFAGHGNDGETVLIKSMDRDPVTEKMVHADFYRVKMDEKIEIAIPVHAKGTARGVKEGGLLNFAMHHVTVSCFPADVPHDIVIDVTNLGFNDAVHISDLPKIEGVEFVEEATAVVLAVQPPKAEKAEDAAAPEGAAEPEVIAKGKKEEEEAGD